MIFELTQDFRNAATAIPPEHPKLRMLELLEEAIRRDIQFLDRNPTMLFQCMWNTCWWYDCPEAGRYYTDAQASGRAKDTSEAENSGDRLRSLLEAWRAQREHTCPEAYWLRALRPPVVRLGTGLLSVMRGHREGVTQVTWSPDGKRMASGSRDCAVRLWNASSGAELAILRGHKRAVWGVNCSHCNTALTFNPLLSYVH